MVWGIVGLALLLGVAGLAALLSGSLSDSTAALAQPTSSDPPRPIRVKTIRPSRETIKRTTTQPAHVEPFEKADIHARTAGYVLKVHVDIGDRVKKDETVLAEINLPELEQECRQKEALVEQAQSEVSQAQASLKGAEAMIDAAQAKVEQARADLARYEAEVAFRKIEHERYLQLFNARSVQKDFVDEKQNQYRAAEATLTSAKAAVTSIQANLKIEQARLVKAQADVDSAQARLKVARANYDQAVILLNYGKLRAPFDGVVTRRRVDPGDFVQSAAGGRTEPLFTVMRVDQLRIRTDIAEVEAGLVKVGQSAVLQVDGLRGRQFPGQVARFADALDPATRTMRTEVKLDRPEKLRPGMFGSLTITLAEHANVVLLPANVLLTADGKPYVMIAEQGKARRRAVIVGSNDGVRVRIDQGLDGSEQVISDGKNGVQDGQDVEIVQ
jgi:RND family efflux transporter MFP subunit